jgi:hypothetical protein
MPVLGTTIELGERGIDAVGNGQLAVRIADAQDPVNHRIAEDDPVDIPSRAMNADVVQGGEALATEEVDCPQVQHELL